MLILLSLVVTTSVLAWDAADREAYNNKIALLRVLRDGVQHRASESGDLQTL